MTTDDKPAPPSESDGASVSAGSIALVAILTLLWGVNFPSIKIAVGELEPWTFRVMCVTAGSIGLLTIGRFALGHRLYLAPGDRGALAIAALLNISAFQMLVAFGMLNMDAGRAVIIVYTMPLWAVILGRIFLGEEITRRRAVGLLVGLAGIVVLIGPEIRTLGAAPLGAALMLGASISWAAGTVAIKRRDWKTPTIILTGWQLLIGGIPILIGMLAASPIPDFSQLTPRGWTAVLYSAFVPMIVCHYIWFTLVRKLPAGVVSISTLAIPCVGVYSSALLLDETFGTRELIALLLVVTALGIVLALPYAVRIFRGIR